jgi:chemotaxis protein methyltransferase CheR
MSALTDDHSVGPFVWCLVYGFKELFDVVFCRNVMIYFDAPTQRKVLERIHKVMKPGAVLYVGHAENFSDSKDLFSLKGKTVYERSR